MNDQRSGAFALLIQLLLTIFCLLGIAVFINVWWPMCIVYVGIWGFGLLGTIDTILSEEFPDEM